MTTRHTLETFAAQSSATHNNKFTYTALDFTKARPVAHIICPAHGLFVQNMHDHLKGRGCPKCGIAARGDARKETFEKFVPKALKVHGDKYKYVSLDTTTSRPAIVAICPTHGEFKHAAAHHLQGRGCPKCGIESLASKRATPIDKFESQAVKVHGQKYTYIRTLGKRKVLIECPLHGQFEQATYGHLGGQRCPSCAKESQGTHLRKNFDDFLREVGFVHQGQYTYPEGRINYPESGKSYLHIECPKHGMFVQTLNDHLNAGQGCPKCSNRISKPNVAISNYLDSIGVSHVKEHRLKTGKTLDIYIPQLSLGIEYNGIYWHSSKFKENTYHLTKTRDANAEGIKVIHIWSHEWRLKQDLVKTYLASMCGQFTQRVYARKCIIHEVPKAEARLFLESNHIQGYNQLSTYTGLKCEGKWVAMMGFSHNTSNRRAKAADDLVELTRFACVGQVVGGFSKLLKAHLASHPDIKRVVSFSDRRFFDGKTYEVNGFTKEETLAPDYSYVIQGRDELLKHKSNFTKGKLAQMFGSEACEGLTERQITEANNLWRVYDCGKVRWVFTVA